MGCETVEDARALLRHRSSSVTADIYRLHFGDKEREKLRAQLEARHGTRIILEMRSEAGGEPSHGNCEQRAATGSSNTPALALA